VSKIANSLNCSFRGYDCGTVTITNDLRSYMATSSQTLKLISNWCNWEHIPVAEFSCNQWQRSEGQILKFLIQTLWNVAIFQTLSSTFDMWIILTYSEKRSWRIMAFYFQKNSNAALFHNLTTYLQFQKWLFRTLPTFIFWNTFHSSDFL